MDKLARQSGIIPYRLELDVLQVLLITSRKTGRWVIPKGNIGKGHNARRAAEREAYEEAGVSGDVEKMPLGSYTYGKALKDGTSRPTVVKVFAMHVLKEAKAWPEMAERRSEWMEPKEAARRVHEAGLATLFLQLAERHRKPTQVDQELGLRDQSYG
jgi:8-oxo-dGTP pyrophosphatase MutT (NUDIX family)